MKRTEILRAAFNWALSYPVARPRRVSVVIPFHGAESELRRCLGCLYLQSTRDFEVIIVADACPISRSIGNDLRKIGIPVKIIRNKSQSGALESRCRGARSARGKYLWFMDHDDTVNEEFLTIMVGMAENSAAEIVECPILFFPEAAPPWLGKRFQGDEALHNREILEAFLRGKSLNNLINKLIQRRLWEKATTFLETIDCRPLTYAEDILCVVNVYLHASSYRAVDRTHYNHMYRSDSTMNTRDVDRICQSLRSFSTVLSLLDPILSQHARRDDVESFWDREVGWSVNYLIGQANGNLTPEMESLVDSLRSRYLARLVSE
jgi:glycosyltransferase involved in cell wall biosynthesis